MLDIKWIRENPQKAKKAMELRAVSCDVAKILELDTSARERITNLQTLRHEKKEKSDGVAGLYKSGKKDQAETLKDEVKKINSDIARLEEDNEAASELQNILEHLPNIPASDVPAGSDEQDNKFLHDFCPEGQKIDESPGAKQHFELGEQLGMMDFVQTAKISGSRFVTLTDQLARLERALANFMLDININKFGYSEVSPPFMVRPRAMHGAGQLPKFAEESFETTNDYRLISTGEVPLVNMVADKILCESELPLRYCAYTPCFRSEAGSAGKDTRGMIRLHQFSKVELVSITSPDDAGLEHDRMLECAEHILKSLELPYRVMLLCAGDMGFSATKTYDIEVWMPGQKKYREISSCSNCADFQARRMKARYKKVGQGTNHFVHTLNSSALPTGRTIAAILENFQNDDGSIAVPKVLHEYMGGITTITAK